MDATVARKALEGLRTFVKALVKSRVKDKESWRRWRKKEGSEAFMEKCFGYERKDKMPSITGLVAPFFHPELPLVGLNYSHVAHNVLHAFHDGWTPALRLCRGIVFDRKGNLVAKPFEKFFNYGEHAETKELPNLPFVATVKHDGHLGIIFRYGDGLVITTRGSFESRTSVLGTEMLAKKKAWIKAFPKGVTVLCEIIHPTTRVHVEYGRTKGFILIGAYDNATLADYDRAALVALGGLLKVPVTETWRGSSIEELRAFMADLTVSNQEGFVVRFANGLRVKFKFASYINLMVEEKLSYTYLMNRVIAGTLEKMIGNLPEEVLDEARGMVAKLEAVKAVEGDVKAKRAYLYALDAEKKDSQYYRGICRKFLKHLEAA